MKNLNLNINVCGATSIKEEYWERLAISPQKSFKRNVPDYFLKRILGDNMISGSFDLVNKVYCFAEHFCRKDNCLCKSCPLRFHCNYFVNNKSGFDGLPSVIDLFSGVGGLSLGFEQENYEIKYQLDSDEKCISTLKYNYPHRQQNIECESIENWLKTHQDFSNEETDILLAGIPCQSFSNANQQRQTNDPRHSLYEYFLKATEKSNPKVAVIENVTGIKKINNEILTGFDEIGFDCQPVLLNAVEYGIPQNRSRIFYIAINRSFVENSYKVIDIVVSSINDQKSTKEVSLKEAIGDLPPLEPSRRRNKTEYESDETGWAILRHNLDKASDYARSINTNTSSGLIFNHKSRFNNDRDIEIFDRLTPGENSLSEKITKIMPYKKRNHVFKDKYFRLRWDRPCRTITAHMRYDCNSYIHPSQPRGLTVREAARIQGFPDDYIFTGPFQSLYRQVGNAVPPPLAAVIARSIKLIL